MTNQEKTRPAQDPDTEALDEDDQPPVVRLRKPKLILLAFEGTIAPLDWEERVITPYLRDHLLAYIKSNYTANDVWPLVDLLKSESFDEHFIYGHPEAPLIVPFDATGENTHYVLQTVYNYVMWQLGRPKSSQASLELARFCWEQGYRNQAMQTIIFEDVLPAVRQWREMGIKVAVYSPIIKQQCRLMLSFTTIGNFASHLDYIFDHENAGPRREQESYGRIATAANLDKSELLFMCDYGQDVMYASEAGAQVLLFYRPGNRKNRSYYTVRFPNAVTMANIEFI